MELKNYIVMEVEREERIYRLEIPAGAPYGELYDAVYECLVKVSQEMQQAVQASQPQAPVQEQEVVVEEKKEEVDIS
jgi:hypothetical protein